MLRRFDWRFHPPVPKPASPAELTNEEKGYEAEARKIVETFLTTLLNEGGAILQNHLFHLHDPNKSVPFVFNSQVTELPLSELKPYVASFIKGYIQTHKALDDTRRDLLAYRDTFHEGST